MTPLIYIRKVALWNDLIVILETKDGKNQIFTYVSSVPYSMARRRK